MSSNDREQNTSRLRGSNLSLDDLDNRGFGERRQITELVTLASDDLAHDTTHDLARASLGQVGDDVDLLGRGKGTDDLANLADERLDETSLAIVLELRLERDERVYGLASELVVGTDDGGLSDTVVEDEGRLDLSG